MSKISERVRVAIKAAMSQPGAAEVLPFTKGTFAGIASAIRGMHDEHEGRLQHLESVTQLDLLEQGTTEMHGEQKGRIDGLLSRVEKNAAQMSALHARVAALERKAAKG